MNMNMKMKMNMNMKMKSLFYFLYRHTFLCRLLYRYTIAYQKLFPNKKFLDPETPYKDEIRLIWKAIKFPSYQLEEVNMGIVLSQLIQSDISYTEAHEICAIINSRYKNELHYINRRTIIEKQLEDFERKQRKDRRF
jgi:hypothetical protein